MRRAGRTRRLPSAQARVARRAERTRQEIIEGAARALAASGPRTTLREIASEAGLAPASLYSYFASKRDIMNQAAKKLRRALLDPLEASCPSGLDPGQCLELLVLRELEFLAAHRFVLRMIHALPDLSSELRTSFVGGLEAFLKREPRAELLAPTCIAARVLLGIALAMIADWPTADGPDVAGTARSIVTAFQNGLVAAP